MFKNVLISVMTFVAVLGVSVPAYATSTNSNAGGGNVDCPAGTVLLAKYNLTGSAYVAESGGTVVSVTGGANSGTFTVLDATKVVTAVVVKGSTDAKTDTYNPGVTSGTFNNTGLVNNGDNTPGISNVKFCGTAKPANTTTTVNPTNPVTPTGGSGGGNTTTQPAAPQAVVPVAGANAGSGPRMTAASLSALMGSVAVLGYGLLRFLKASA